MNLEFSAAQKRAIGFYRGSCNVIASAGSGKALLNGTGVLTPRGYVAIEKLKVGDTVFGQDGKKHTVIGVYPQGKKRVYEITFSDNNKIKCCKDHLWFYKTLDMVLQREFLVQPLKKILKIPLEIWDIENQRSNIMIPMSKPVDFGNDNYELTFTPYSLGVLLAAVDSMDDEQIEKFADENPDVVQRVFHELLIKKLHIPAVASSSATDTPSSIFCKMLRDLKFCDIYTWGISIPKSYLYTSIEDRFKLLQGLIDAGVTRAAAHYEFCTTSVCAATDIQFLVESLGMTAAITTNTGNFKIVNGKKVRETTYCLRINPSSTFRKIYWCKKRAKEDTGASLLATRSIMKIKKLHKKRDMTCIKVNSADGSFLTEHCIVTHNTGVLVHRIENLVKNHNVDADKILAITFSKKAKENMQERLNKLLPDDYCRLNVETFHSFGCSVVRKFSYTPHRILSADWERNKIIGNIYKELTGMDEIPGDKLAALISYISMQKNHLLFPSNSFTAVEEKVYAEYEKYKRNKDLLDFDDMLTMAYEILRDNEEALDHYQTQFEFILADEMQDTNTAQYKIIRLIAQKHQNVFFVDDPLQNIFMWRGSDNKYVLDFDDEWENDPTTINLNCNYRSSKDIVQLANKFALTIPESNHKYYAESISNKEYFKTPEYHIYKNERDEAENIAQKIQRLVTEDKYGYRDIAILARTNAQLMNFESAMHKFSVPYSIVDGLSFVERKEIKIVLSYLRLACDVHDDTAFLYIYNKPNRYLGKQFLERVKEQAKNDDSSMFCTIHQAAGRNWKYASGVAELSDVVNCLRRMKASPVRKQIEYIRSRLSLDRYVSDEVSDDNNAYDKIDNLNTLSDIADEYSSTEEFVSYMNALAAENRELSDGVRLMTIHKSKGLEYPVVFIVGVNEGMLPHHRNSNLNEERRLMYVAITRAEKELYISSTEQYRKNKTRASSFIEDLFFTT